MIVAVVCGKMLSSLTKTKAWFECDLGKCYINTNILCFAYTNTNTNIMQAHQKRKKWNRWQSHNLNIKFVPIRRLRQRIQTEFDKRSEKEVRKD